MQPRPFISKPGPPRPATKAKRSGPPWEPDLPEMLVSSVRERYWPLSAAEVKTLGVPFRSTVMLSR